MMADYLSKDHDPENCPGCRPVVLDLGPEGKMTSMTKVDAKLTALACQAFDKATPRQRKAWHRVTCLNSGDVRDLTLVRELNTAIQEEFKNAGV